MEHTVHLTKMQVNDGAVGEHVSWLARFMMTGVAGGGVLSAEIIPPTSPDQRVWTLVQRFHQHKLIDEWRTNPARTALLKEVATKTQSGAIVLSESEDVSFGTIGSVAVAIVTQVKPGFETDYQQCEEQFQAAQAKYRGYQGVYLQPPTKGTPGVWTTLIRFDTPEELDEWFASEERRKLLEKSDPVVKSTDYQTIQTSFPGWFPAQEVGGKGPPNWKTAMLILLGLYPIVVLEMRYLAPSLHGLPSPVAFFFSNIISVGLTTWVTMPLAIKTFRPWLFPKSHTQKWVSPVSFAALIVIYALEIAIFCASMPR